MKKYVEYLDKKFETWSSVIAILCAVLMIIALVIEMSAPVDAGEIEHHYSQLEMIKQDSANLCKLENADITIKEDGMTVRLKGKQHHLKAFFDENGNYSNATIVDNRVGSNILASGFVVLGAFGLGMLLSYALLCILIIPALVYGLFMQIKHKWQTRKRKTK